MSDDESHKVSISEVLELSSSDISDSSESDDESLKVHVSSSEVESEVESLKVHVSDESASEDKTPRPRKLLKAPRIILDEELVEIESLPTKPILVEHDRFFNYYYILNSQ